VSSLASSIRGTFSTLLLWKPSREFAKLRNSLVHKSGTYGIPFQEGDPSRSKYKGRHIFTDPEGLKQLMDDVDAATKVMGKRLREAGLAIGEEMST
jgi:hypothetical protein